NMDDAAVRSSAESVHEELLKHHVDVLFDDRDERPGVKFKDADLIGVPFRITVGKRKLDQGLVELLERSTKRMSDVKLPDVVPALKERLGS
ncbi:MAG: His/Gly/Thr/Pro-type tRNA ligase C-terminal domain-containing protein, partial [Terriglobia bacterium]